MFGERYFITPSTHLPSSCYYILQISYWGWYPVILLYYKINAESIRSRKRDNYQNNPQNKKDASRARYNADPNKAKETARKQCNNNPEPQKAASHEQYRTHSETIKEDARKQCKSKEEPKRRAAQCSSTAQKVSRS